MNDSITFDETASSKEAVFFCFLSNGLSLLGQGFWDILLRTIDTNLQILYANTEVDLRCAGRIRTVSESNTNVKNTGNTKRWAPRAEALQFMGTTKSNISKGGFSSVW